MARRIVTSIGAGIAVVALACGAFLGLRLQQSQRHIEALTARLDTRQRLPTQVTRASVTPVTPPSSGASLIPDAKPVEATAPPRAAVHSDEVILTAALRDVLVSMEQCSLANRTLRCSFTVTNQSPAEKQFVMGIGGTTSRFEDDRGGASFFDDLGNDFLSVGGAVGNHVLPNCDNYAPCLLEKTLTPAVKTSGSLRFDAVDPNVTLGKLLRLKWSDGQTWVTMDFRGIPIIRAPN